MEAVRKLSERAKIWDRPPRAIGYVKSKIPKNKNVFAIILNGDCMEPELHHEDIVIIDPDTRVKPGDFVVVKNDKTGGLLLKQLNQEGDTLVLHALNPKYNDRALEGHTIIGKVVERQANPFCRIPLLRKEVKDGQRI